MLIPVGAALVARDNVVEAAKPYTSRDTAERELTKLQRQVRTDLKKFERRGTTARNRVSARSSAPAPASSASCVSAATRPPAWSSATAARPSVRSRPSARDVKRQVKAERRKETQ